jgi:hypothetical protein
VRDDDLASIRMIGSRPGNEPETCRVVELRRYVLRPDARETLIELFDRELVESQEDVGMQVLGQFRDLDAPDSFVWLRGFGDMQSRERALRDFYGGEVWKRHAAAANATMLDVDNVLLLRPIDGLSLDADGRPGPGSTGSGRGLLAVTIYPLAGSTAADFPAFFRREVEPELIAIGINVLATFVTEHSPNTYPALPVREDENVFVWMALFADEADHARRLAELERSAGWHGRVSTALAQRLAAHAEVLRLTPTARSLVHG